MNLKCHVLHTRLLKLLVDSMESRFWPALPTLTSLEKWVIVTSTCFPSTPFFINISHAPAFNWISTVTCDVQAPNLLALRVAMANAWTWSPSRPPCYHTVITSPIPSLILKAQIPKPNCDFSYIYGLHHLVSNPPTCNP